MVRRVEHVDLDAYGVVHFSRYAAFCETAVLEMLECLGNGVTSLERRGLELRVRELKLRYATPARMREDLLVSLEAPQISEVRMRMNVHIASRGTVNVNCIAYGYLELVLVDSRSGQPVLIPEDIRCALAS